VYKKLFFFLLMGAMAPILCFAQTKKGDTKSNAAWGGRGAIVANIGYGFLNIWRVTVFENGFNFDKKKVTATGPVVIAGEYGVGNNFGVGIQLAAGRVKGVFTQKGVLGGGADYIETTTLNSFQIQLRGNYHLGSSEKFDPYIGLGLGYGNYKLKSSNNAGSSGTLTTASVPSVIGYTGAVGARYYFNQTTGLFAEAGFVGGCILQLGLVAKF
jgi:Outer membrane protein beta-barrel domain